VLFFEFTEFETKKKYNLIVDKILLKIFKEIKKNNKFFEIKLEKDNNSIYFTKEALKVDLPNSTIYNFFLLIFICKILKVDNFYGYFGSLLYFLKLKNEKTTFFHKQIIEILKNSFLNNKIKKKMWLGS